jgi:uncharacterized membrane protein SpoIIM required for sporulation/uncharacterized RDD family membrane protein YckC
MTRPNARAQRTNSIEDRRLEVETPEQVAVSFDLAGPGSRYAAFLLDGIVLIAILLVMLFAGWLVLAGAGVGGRALVSAVGPLLAAAVFLLLFLVPYGYFVYFEGMRNGQTPGKKYFSLRVVQDGGYPITLHGAVIRNLVRLVDMQPFASGLLGGIFILFHPKAQRLGDMAAGTEVVRERRVHLELDEDRATIGPPRLREEEYAVLRDYVLRRSTLEAEARSRVAAKLATHFRAYEHTGWHTDDTLLLRVYEDESARRATSGGRVGTGSAAASALVRRQKRRWRDYRSLLERARARGLTTLEEAEVSRFAALYREVAADLARARTYGGSAELLYTLEHDVGGGHNLLYAPRRRRLRRAWEWLQAGFPALVRRRARVIAAAALLLFGPAAIAGAAIALEPGRARHMLPAEMIARAEDGARRAAEGRGYFEAPPTAMPLLSSRLIANNVQVSFVAFAGGVLAGLGTVLVLLLNGIFLGGVVGLFHAERLGLYLWSFVLPHGVIELTAICIAGGAGLWLGSAVVVPGRLTRSHALVERGREAVSLLAGVVMLLLLAGLIEGFISPSSLPAAIKLGAGALFGILLFAYLFLSGRSAGEGHEIEHEPPPSPPPPPSPSPTHFKAIRGV